MSRLLVGLCTHEMDLSFLKETLPVLEELRQSTKATVAVVDNSWSDELQELFSKQYPAFHYLRAPGGNVGYGASYNFILKNFPDHEFYFVTTSDVLLSLEGFKELYQKMQKDSELMMASGKLYFWDFPHLKTTDQIDTLGIWALRKHHFYDLGQGEKDQGQYDARLPEIFGISGASFLIRTEVIPKLHGAKDILFDPGMWMYKEDIDLSYRLRWLGEKLQIWPVVLGWHARTVANTKGQNALALHSVYGGKRAYAKVHSYKNHWRLLKNHFTWRYGIFTILSLAFYELMKGFYLLFTHPRVFFSGLKTLLFEKGQRSTRVTSPKTLQRFFH